MAITLLVPLVFMIFFHSCVTFRSSPQEIDQYFTSKKIHADQRHYNIGARTIHYVSSGDSLKPMVLFVHGSPGSLNAFIEFLTDSALRQKAFLITTDRPGFGYSNFGNAEPSLQKQAAALKPILERYKGNRPVVLVGHSLGGPLICRMAMDYPTLIDGLVIVAGSIDPELEPDEAWFRAPLATPFLSWILPRTFRASNEEIYQLKPELEKMLPLWKNISCPVVIVHGRKDSLVPFGNVAFGRKMLINARVDTLVEDSMDHFVPWSHPHLIREGILRLLTPDQIVDVVE